RRHPEGADLRHGIRRRQDRLPALRALPQRRVPQLGWLDHPPEAARPTGVVPRDRRLAIRALDRGFGRDRLPSPAAGPMSEELHLPARRGERREAAGGETRTSRPALAHLFWWFMFAQGGVIAAILLPVHILFQGILGPLGLVRVASLHDSNIIGNPIVKLYLLVLIAVPFFHFAHRLRYLLVDFGVPAARSLPAQVVFYGGAVLVIILTIYVLLTTAPISF